MNRQSRIKRQTSGTDDAPCATARIYAKELKKSGRKDHLPAGREHTWAFATLFKLSPALEERVENITIALRLANGRGEGKKDHDRGYVAVHARIGGNISTGGETVGWSDPARNTVDSVNLFAFCALEMQKKVDGSKTVPVYVASDSETFKRRMKAVDSFTGDDGDCAVRYAEDLCIFQVDKSNAEADGAWECNVDAYADLILLAKSDCLVESLSGFSYLANVISQPLVDEPNSWRCAQVYDACSSNAHVSSHDYAKYVLARSPDHNIHTSVWWRKEIIEGGEGGDR